MKIKVVDLTPLGRARRVLRVLRSAAYLVVLFAGVIAVDEDVRRVLG